MDAVEATTTPTLNCPRAVYGPDTSVPRGDSRENSRSDTADAPNSHKDFTSDGSADLEHCVICLDTIAEPCRAQPCGHGHFDFLCLVSWLLQSHPSCPLCKAVVTTVDYGPRGEGVTSVDKKDRGAWKTFVVPTEPEPEPDQPDQREPARSAQLARPDQPSRPIGRRRSRRTFSPSSSAATSASPALSEATIARRRRVYRLGLYALHVGANRLSRYYRELTPRVFAQDPDLVSRARAFVRRELMVLGLPGGARSDGLLLEYVVTILQTIDIQASTGQAEDLLRPFLGHNAPHFLHELRSWLRSPYLTLESWDRHVQYAEGREAERKDQDRSRQRDRPRQNTEIRDAPVQCLENQVRGRGRDRGDSWRPAATQRRSAAQRQRQRRGSTTLDEACRRYDPS